MPNEIRTKRDPSASFTITLASLANGSARQSTMVTNTNDRPGMILQMVLQSGTAPTAGSIYEIFLLRGDGSGYRTDGAGASDAAITIENAQLIGSIVVTNNANKDFYGDFDTAPLGPLDEEFGIAVRNSSGQSLNGTEANHDKDYELYLPEIQ